MPDQTRGAKIKEEDAEGQSGERGKDKQKLRKRKNGAVIAKQAARNDSKESWR